jgi:POT family proton-dependent oligopeptide transporter
LSQALPPTKTGVPTPTGHPPGLWFFFWGEFAERASFYGMRAILPIYLASVMQFGDKDGGTIYYCFKMAAYFLPLLGGIIADRWLGRYWTIVGFSIPYVIGHFILGVENQWFCLIALFLFLAPGTGVIKPNISSLLGQTYDQQRPGQDGLRNSGFQWFYFAINIGALISMFIVPIIRDHKGYAIAFQFPAWLMVLALAIFAGGKRFYAKEERVVHVKTPEEKKQQWATLVRLLGIFGLIVFWWVAYEHNDSIWVFFARDYMNHQDTAFTLPSWLGGARYEPKADSYQYINSLFVLIFIPVFNLIFRAIDPNMKIITPVRKVLAGFLLTAAAIGVMMLAAYSTNGGAAKVSAWWLVVAYIVLTAGEVLLYGTMLDLSYAAAPKSMKGFITACFLLTNTLGNFVNMLFSRLYGGSLKDAPGRWSVSPTTFFGLTICIVLAATVAFYFVGKQFERGQAKADDALKEAEAKAAGDVKAASDAGLS